MGTYYLSRNSICGIRYKSFLQTGQECPPESTCQTWGTFFSSRRVWNDLLEPIRLSASPQDTQSRRSFLLAAASGARSPDRPKRAEEKPPTEAKVSRCRRPIVSACPPPIDSPAMPRCSASVFTG